METRNIETLKPNPNNDRILTDEGKKMLIHAMSMGNHSTFLILPDGMIIDGNNRWLNRHEGGWANKEFPCHILTATQDADRATRGEKSYFASIDGVIVTREDGTIPHYYISTEALYKAYSFGRNGEAAYDDPEAFANKWETWELDPKLFTVSFEAPKNVEFQLASILREKEPLEDTPPALDQEKTVSEKGKVYQLGRHKIMCGDATQGNDLEKLMGTDRADMIFTDPPYNVSYEGKTADALTIENDTQSATDFYAFLYNAFTLLFNYSKSGAAIYVCHADSERVNFTKAFQDAQWKLAEVVIWVKDVFVMGRQDYQWQHEPILYGWKEGAAHYFNGGRAQTTIWRDSKPTASREHPTMKPISLITKALLNNSKGDDIVLDPFLCSGSTLIACEQAGRICYGLELDPKYCDVIRKRYAKFMGKENEWETLTPAIPETENIVTPS